MRFIGNLLRIYSYVFEAILCVMALAMAVLLFNSPAETVHLGWIVFPEKSLATWLLLTGIVGLLAAALAISGRVRPLHFLFALAVFVLLVKGLFFSSWRFNGDAEAKRAGILILGALVAAAGAIPVRSSHEIKAYKRSR